jgi:hypothetical protein
MRDIETIVTIVKAALPRVACEQLKGTHPADDDGLWFFSTPDSKNQVQIESPTGMCPFLVEGDGLGQTARCSTVESTAETVIRWFAAPP